MPHKLKSNTLIRLAIGLFRSPSAQTIKDWHWSLLVTDVKSKANFHGKVCFWHIVNPYIEGTLQRDRSKWVVEKGVITLSESASFKGVVELPEPKGTTFDDINSLLESLPPMPYNATDGVKKDWNCACWVADVIIEYGPIWGMVLDPKVWSMERRIFIAHVLERGRKLEDGQAGVDFSVGQDGIKVVPL